MTPRYTANTNFRSHVPKNGFTRFLAEPGFNEDWILKYARGRIKGHKSRWMLEEGDLIKINCRITRSMDVKFYGIITVVADKLKPTTWIMRFYNTKEEAVAQRILRDIQPKEPFTYVMKLNLADFRTSASPHLATNSLLKG
ncbi:MULTISPECIES: hypothetical protein [Pseudomonadota]|uniref:hypothetical protein n=1 Tax=Pseudomonadota TaxID=1224 RepID=UPI0026170FDE|nr:MULTISPECIES: hypothetical protein [Pseudomonadota]